MCGSGWEGVEVVDELTDPLMMRDLVPHYVGMKENWSSDEI